MPERQGHTASAKTFLQVRNGRASDATPDAQKLTDSHGASSKVEQGSYACDVMAKKSRAHPDAGFTGCYQHDRASWP
ncbi:hypothetical protein AB4Z00_18680 [Novosphingobium sp. YAF33]